MATLLDSSGSEGKPSIPQWNINLMKQGFFFLVLLTVVALGHLLGGEYFDGVNKWIITKIIIIIIK